MCNCFTATLPLITTQPSSNMVEAGNAATFVCSAISYGNASITWKRMSSKLPVTAKVIVTKSLNEITSVLTIEKTIEYYKGYYYCVIENSIGQVNSTFAYCNITGKHVFNTISNMIVNLTFYTLVPCPEMITLPEAVVVYPDAMVTFSCLAWSFGRLAYEWNRNGSSALPPNSTISCNTAMHELSVLNVQEKDEGPYCCVVSNECGNITECAWLEVDSKLHIRTVFGKAFEWENVRGFADFYSTVKVLSQVIYLF